MLLRGSGIHFTVVAQSGLLHARPFLQRILTPLLNDLVHKSSHSFEIDPSRLNGPRELEANTNNLVQLANHVLAALLRNADNMPVYVAVGLLLRADLAIGCPPVLSGTVP